jgi:ABC-type protease/lipase transport system fused ATPase/permease subunit
MSVKEDPMSRWLRMALVGFVLGLGAALVIGAPAAATDGTIISEN